MRRRDDPIAEAGRIGINEDWAATIVGLLLLALVLLGASINLSVIVSNAGPAIVQAVALITIVFGFTWWLGGRLGVDDKLRALLSSAVSICGVSAASRPPARCRPRRSSSPTPRSW